MGNLVLVFRIGHFLQMFAKPIFVPEFPIPRLEMFAQLTPVVLACDMPTGQAETNIASGNPRTGLGFGQLRRQSIEDNFSQFGIGVGKELVPPAVTASAPLSPANVTPRELIKLLRSTT